MPEPDGVRELTAPGRGAVTVLEVRGERALARLAALCGGALPPAGGPRLVRLRAEGELLDEALCLVSDEGRIEVHLHGSPPLVRRVRALLAGPAEPGDSGPATLEERALALCAEAASEAAARTLLDQAEGALRRALEPLAGDGPLDARALAELEERGRVVRWLVAPPRVVLAGPVNAGKSTLMNALLGRERVVTSDEEGTTRDAIRERVLLGAYAVELVDTAGEPAGAARDEVERAGVALARAERERADVVLWLAPPFAPAPPAMPRARVVASQDDRLPAGARTGASLSALRDPERARAVVARELRAALDLPEAPWVRGAPAPFDDALRAALRRLADARGDRGRETAARAALRALLAAR